MKVTALVQGVALCLSAFAPSCASGSGQPEVEEEMPPVEHEDGIYSHPDPSGEYSVGLRVLHLEDESRPEPVTADEDDHRELTVQVFYPSTDTEAPYAPITDGLSAGMIADGLLQNFHESVQTRSRLDVALAESSAPFPVLVYNHDLEGWSFENQELLEELASRGWVVFSLSHTYSSRATTLEDGSIVGTEHDLPVEVAQPTTEGRIERFDAMDQLLEDIWAPDVTYLLDELERMQSGDRDDPLSGHLALDQLGLVGTVFGGAASFFACSRDPRCKAAVNLNGSLFGEVPFAAEVPLLRVTTGAYTAVDWDRVQDMSTGTTETLWLPGATGEDVISAHLMFDSVAQATLEEELERRRALLDRTFAHVTSFLDEHVRGEESTRPDPDDLSVYEICEGGQATTPLRLLGEVWPVVGQLKGDIAVSLDQEEPTALGTERHFAFSELLPETSHVLRGSAPNYVDTVVRTPSARRTLTPSVPLFLPSILSDLSSSVDVSMEDGTGHILVSIEQFHEAKWVGPVLGATIDLDEGQIFYGPYAGLNRTLTETGGGSSLAFNLQPGTHSLTVVAPGKTCVPAFDDEVTSGEVQFEVGADALTIVDVFCE